MSWVPPLTLWTFHWAMAQVKPYVCDVVWCDRRPTHVVLDVLCPDHLLTVLFDKLDAWGVGYSLEC